MIPAWASRIGGWLLAALAVVGAVLGYGRVQRGAGRDEGRQDEREEVRDAEDRARQRMDEADVPRSRRDLADRLRNGGGL